MDIDKLTQRFHLPLFPLRFSSLMDIDKLTPKECVQQMQEGFSSLMDIDKLTRVVVVASQRSVLVL